MMIGQRIERLLRERKISQAELARRVGVDQSTINQLVKGGSRSSRYLHLIARELQTTPAFLTSETDDSELDAPTAPTISSTEQDWIDKLRGLEPKDREAVIRLTHSLANSATGGTVHSPRRDYRAVG